MATVTDPVQAIVDAAAAAIRSHSVHLDLEIANGGQVIDAPTYLEWKQTISGATR